MMKKLSIILFIFQLLAVCSFAQLIKVPEKAKKHLEKKYPNNTQLDWNNNVTNYTATFTYDGKKHKAYYAMDGIWKYTEIPLDDSELPTAVKNSIAKSRIADWSHEGNAYIVNHKGAKEYRIHRKKGVENLYVFFNKKGKETRSSATLQ
jgi:hypothetical protein